MGNRLYVGNLSYRTTVEELKAEFGTCGKVIDTKIVTDRETGQNRGFGFVEFSTEAEAAEAIQALDGYEFGGRQLRVKMADPKPSPGSGGSRSFGGSEYRPNRSQGQNSGLIAAYGSNGSQERSSRGSQAVAATPPDISRNKPKGPKRRGGGRRREDEFDWG